MVSIRKIAVASSVMLLSAACSAAGLQSGQQAGTPVAASTQQAGSNPPETTQAAEQAAPTQSAPAATTQTAPPAQASPTQTAPAETAPAAQTAPEQEAPASSAEKPIDAATYVPKTEFDNTPYRFNMHQNGRDMTADEFDAWLKQRGVRVATGKPATPLVQTCPTPEGDKGDSDGDGIINCLDACPASEAGQTIGPDGCPVPVSIDLKGVTFAYDKANLGEDAKTVLAEAVEILQRHSSLKVEVAGHTDSRGDAAYNQRLSERRAKAVYDFLVESGIDKARLIGPKGFGETRPIEPNQNPDGSDNPQSRAKNRRVELNIQN